MIDKWLDRFRVNTVPNNVEAKNKLILVFKNAQRHSQLKRHPRFVLANHLSVRFKYRKTLLTVLNRLTQKTTAQHLNLQLQDKTVKSINDF